MLFRYNYSLSIPLEYTVFESTTEDNDIKVSVSSKLPDARLLEYSTPSARVSGAHAYCMVSYVHGALTSEHEHEARRERREDEQTVTEIAAAY
ncbi:hypothetical protein NPX13_g4733 [Xylaria arbuscula]|uniref:Uncharacterized protein n=1 Tax=Xylaria arbuscula TaxID=114810 RepID=A0A9W8NFX5_9PEZI|nr:hypothetical protein NPX13_g4733 [Xylaria arbuscula]